MLRCGCSSSSLTQVSKPQFAVTKTNNNSNLNNCFTDTVDTEIRKNCLWQTESRKELEAMETQNQHTKDQKKSNGPEYEVKLGTTLLENWVEEVKMGQGP